MTRSQTGGSLGEPRETAEKTSGSRRHRRRRAGLATTAVVAAAALLAGACGTDTVAGQAPPSTGNDSGFINAQVTDDQPVPGGQIVYGVPAETSSFHPALASWASYSLTIARAIYDTVAIYDENGDVQPFLAETFEHNDDYTVWKTTLRPGVTFSNGKPFTAEAFVTAQRAMKASPVLAEVFDGITDWEVTGELTFTTYAARPWTSFPEAMASQIGVAVDPEWLDSDDILRPVGTGPFVVDRWDVNKEMVLKRNPRYWRKDEWGITFPYLDQVTFRVIVDETGRVEALRNGEIDLMMQTYATPQVAEMLDEARAGKLQAFSDREFESPEDYILVNTARPPFDDLDARKALAHALDLDDYVATVTGGLDEPADSPWKPGSKWYTPVDYPRHDKAEARRLVDQVKARNGGRFSVTLLGNPSTESIRIQQWVQQQLKDVGIDVTLDSQLQQTKIITMIKGDYQLALTQQFDNVNPGQDTVYWQDWNKPLGTLSLNFARIYDSTLHQLSLDGLGSTGEVQREKYAAMSRRLAELVPFVWLAHAARTVIASPRLMNVVRAEAPGGHHFLEFMQGSHPIHQIWLKR